MQYIRILSLKHHWDDHHKRFTSLAFRPSSKDGAISVVQENCAVETSGTICSHIPRYYGGIASDPPVFWPFSEEILPGHRKIELSPTEDPCHYNILELSKKEAEIIFRSFNVLANFSFCSEAGPARLTLEKALEIRATYP